jgi:ribosomal protein S27AE
MKDELTRRGFLKAAGFAVAGATVLSRTGWTQEEEKKPEEDKKEEEKPEEDPKEEENYDDLFEDSESDEEETRACPQCGALMYRQGRTWTCENCGYSYVE